MDWTKGELSVEVTVAHAESPRDVSNRPGRVRRELPDRSLASRERGVVERFRRSEGRLDGIEGLRRCPARRQVVPQGRGPRPCLQQVHNPTPQRGWREPENGPAADRGGDDPDAVRLAQRLVDDRPIVRTDAEPCVGDK